MERLSQMMLRPIQRGRAIRIVQPAYRFDVECAETLGMRLAAHDLSLEFPSVRPGYGKLSDNDDGRTAELMNAFRDESIGAILVGHGGYGCGRLLDRLDWSEISRNPKPIVGFSDATALTVALTRSIGENAIHGPNAKSLAHDADDETIRALSAILRADWLTYNDCLSLVGRQSRLLRPGHAEGRMIGGNLSVLSSLCGTAYAPHTSEAILFLEDWNEPQYRFDRMLTQLKQTGFLDGISGLVLGHLEISRVGTDLGEGLETRILDLVPADIPVLSQFPVGHGSRNTPLILSGCYRLSDRSLMLIPE